MQTQCQIHAENLPGHEKDKGTIMEDDKVGFLFVRHHCKHCNVWLTDIPVEDDGK